MIDQTSGRLRAALNFHFFSSQTSGFSGRAYQNQVATAILRSIRQRQGLSFAVMFPRQSGKNTLQALIEAYLLWRMQFENVEMVKISPTWKPQSLNAMHRLETVLQANPLTRGRWLKSAGYIYSLGKARLTFLSGSPETNIVGATANLLLQVDEAQDILPAKYDKDIAPMAAAANATRVFWGTAWTADTLLARELRAARSLQEQDTVRRAFVVTADEVGREVPAYANFVSAQVKRWGRSHPMLRTQFYCEELEASASLFTAERLAALQGNHPAQDFPQTGSTYAFLLDVGGADFSSTSPDSTPEKQHDSTALTILEVIPASHADAYYPLPLYRIVARREWVNIPQTVLLPHLQSLAETWQARRIVVDASGIGAGLAAFLQAALAGRVIPFTFTSPSKSRLGWDLLSLIESGRLKEYAVDPLDWGESARLHRRFQAQWQHLRTEISSGQTLRWGVPANSRDPHSGELLHDDLIFSAALVCALEGETWGSGQSVVIKPPDLFGIR
ncbi:MAG: hypothetical protein WCI88_11365 [Chloroflexota bacterium]